MFNSRGRLLASPVNLRHACQTLWLITEKCSLAKSSFNISPSPKNENNLNWSNFFQSETFLLEIAFFQGIGGSTTKIGSQWAGGKFMFMAVLRKHTLSLSLSSSLFLSRTLAHILQPLSRSPPPLYLVGFYLPFFLFLSPSFSLHHFFLSFFLSLAFFLFDLFLSFSLSHKHTLTMLSFYLHPLSFYLSPSLFFSSLSLTHKLLFIDMCVPDIFCSDSVSISISLSLSLSLCLSLSPFSHFFYPFSSPSVYLYISPSPFLFTLSSLLFLCLCVSLTF